MELKTGTCHCGAISFTVELENGLSDLRRCNCSLCRRKGYIMASVPLARLTVKQGEDKLSLYQWNTGTAKHYFCSVCGVYTHHQRRSNPEEYGVNIGCFDDVDPLAFGEVAVGNGAGMSGHKPEGAL